MQLNNRSQGGNSHHIQTSDCITVDPALDSHADMKRDSQMMNVCAGCNQPITEKYLLRAVDQVWHEDCLKCSCCDCRLGEVGSSLFVKANLLLCKQDYLRLFGTPGQCSACLQSIPAFEMVMRAKEHVYHMECFACEQCKLRFCVGDRFYLYGSRIVCENHSKEFDQEGADNTTFSPHTQHTNNNNNYEDFPKALHLMAGDQSNIESSYHQQNGNNLVNSVN